jgi:8-oxo-dGTP pyrophosphatase MutT (NUDIX family)
MNFFVYRVDLSLDAEKVEITLNDDLVKYEWVSLKDLSKYTLTAPSTALFTKLGYLKSAA